MSKYILSIDGGGVRGLASAVFLSELEKNISLSLSDKFDLIVGTSTGGIISLGISILDLHEESLVSIYSEENLRNNLRIPAVNINQEILVSKELEQTSRVMVKDEDVCIHCGLCAERCPTGAWDMQNFLYQEAKVYS